MKKFHGLKVLSLVALSLVLLLSLFSCGGDLEVKKFTPVLKSITTTYLEGEEVDFSGIKVQIEYEDPALNTELTLADGLQLEYDENITATAGNKELKVIYDCPHTNTRQEAIIPILVEVDPDAVRHDSYVVDASGMKTTYILGETIVFDGIKVIEKFTNGGADVEMTDLSLISYTYDAATITSSVGNKTIAVSYNGESAGTVTVTVNYPAVTGIAVNTAGVKTEYLKGETASLAGLTVTLNYENGETRTVDTVTAVSNLEALLSSFGEKDVYVKLVDPISGAEQSASFKIKVDGIEDYTVDATGAKTEYDAGEAINLAGVTVTANYYFGKTELVSSGIGFVYADDITNTAGNKQITVTVNGETVGAVTIKVGDIPSLVLDTANVDLSYRVGETVDLSGLTGTVSYKDDATKNFSVSLSELTYSLDGVTASKGSKKITVTYMLEGEIAITADVTVTVHGVTGYDVETDGVKLGYIVGDTFNFAGVKVYAKYSDGGERVLIDAGRISFDTEVTTATVGVKTVRVFLDGAGAAIGSISVTVEKNTIEKIEILGDYNTVFEKGKDMSFAGMSIKLTYKNGDVVTVLLDKLSFAGADKNTVGKQTVTVSFLDEKNNETASTTFEIEVYQKMWVSGFEESEEIKDFKNSNATAGSGKYGETGFEAQYKNKATYLIGDDNAFIFYPTFSVNNGGTLETLKTGFYSKVTLSLKTGDVYTALEARVLDSARPSVVSYFDGETRIATVNTYKGSYEFTEAAKNKEFKISVLPDDTRYNVPATINPVTLEAKVIDGYNVTEAWQLAVIDNTQDAWSSLKTSKGIEGISPAAVILHKDISITAKDLPDDFLLTLEREDVVYINDATGEEKAVPKGTKYIRDGVFVYVRSGSDDFAIEGNFFNLDLSQFPLVPSPVVFGKELGYGSDFSNMTLLLFQHSSTWWDEAPEKMAKIVLENFSLLGNAGIDKWVDSKDQRNLVSAGGVIFMKAVDYTDVTVKNAKVTSCFIPFFSDLDGYLTIDAVKVYDSYQNALYIWGNRKCDVKDSYFVRAGGPMAIVQSLYRENKTIIKPASLNITGTVIDSKLSGQEIWFSAINASSEVTKIKLLLSELEKGGIGQFLDAKENMNIVSAMISETGSGLEDLGAVVGNYDLEGTVLVNGGGIDRHKEGSMWSKIYNHFAFKPDFEGDPYKDAPYLTVGTGEDAVILFYDGSKLCDCAGNQFGTLPEHQAMGEAFAAADYFTLSQGGLTVTFYRVE